MRKINFVERYITNPTIFYKQIIEEIRILKAILFLWNFGYKKLARSIGSEETIEPARPWVNHIMKEMGMQLKSPIYIDTDRVNTGNLISIDSTSAS